MYNIFLRQIRYSCFSVLNNNDLPMLGKNRDQRTDLRGMSWGINDIPHDFSPYQELVNFYSLPHVQNIIHKSMGEVYKTISDPHTSNDLNPAVSMFDLGYMPFRFNDNQGVFLQHLCYFQQGLYQKDQSSQEYSLTPAGILHINDMLQYAKKLWIQELEEHISYPHKKPSLAHITNNYFQKKKSQNGGGKNGSGKKRGRTFSTKALHPDIISPDTVAIHEIYKTKIAEFEKAKSNYKKSITIQFWKNRIEKRFISHGMKEYIDATGNIHIGNTHDYYNLVKKLTSLHRPDGTLKKKEDIEAHHYYLSEIYLASELHHPKLEKKELIFEKLPSELIPRLTHKPEIQRSHHHPKLTYNCTTQYQLVSGEKIDIQFLGNLKSNRSTAKKMGADPVYSAATSLRDIYRGTIICRTVYDFSRIIIDYINRYDTLPARQKLKSISIQGYDPPHLIPKNKKKYDIFKESLDAIPESPGKSIFEKSLGVIEKKARSSKKYEDFKIMIPLVILGKEIWVELKCMLPEDKEYFGEERDSFYNVKRVLLGNARRSFDHTISEKDMRILCRTALEDDEGLLRDISSHGKYSRNSCISKLVETIKTDYYELHLYDTQKHCTVKRYINKGLYKRYHAVGFFPPIKEVKNPDGDYWIIDTTV